MSDSAELSSLAARALSRRHLLVLSGVAGVTGAAAAGCDGDDPPLAGACPVSADASVTVPTDPPMCGTEDFVAAIALSDLPAGCIRQVSRRNPTLRAFLIHDAAGIYAMTFVCTHTGCFLPPPVTRNGVSVIQCNCHFSEFSLEGVPAQGSVATRALEQYRVRICDGLVYVNTRDIVPAGTRVRPDGTTVNPDAGASLDAAM
ncbi:MAG: Rieske 2Fe-2S domain-containing protein [Myxococcales bacterium]|nr:Rieske 2Fe-2S domain-containing protein [Myxococcales bacterium]